MGTTSPGRSKKFIKDIGIYAIGNLGSKLVTFLLVPLYTFYIEPASYGYYDLSFSIILILMPFLSIQLRDGGFRFLIEANNPTKRRAIVTFVYKALTYNSIIAIGITVILAIFTQIYCLWYLCAFLIAMSIYEVVIQVIRGLGYTKFYVAGGIMCSILIFVFSLIFVVWLKIGIQGIFLANILARILTIAILELRLHILQRYFRYKFNDKKINKEILKYCLPLLPGALGWWIVGSSNRFFIEHYLGLNENGLYAVALKFSAILETLAFIFYQAWQENALRHYNSSDRDKFFSSVFNNYFYVLATLVILFPFAIRLNYFWLVDKVYAPSSEYIYLLSLVAMVYSMAAFFDMGYQCSKKTMRTLPGILIAAVVNLICNYFLIQEFQIYGVIFSSLVTFMALLIYRAFDTRKFFKLKYDKKTFLMFIITIISGTFYYFVESHLITIIYLIVVTVLICILAPEEIKKMILQKLHLKQTN